MPTKTFCDVSRDPCVEGAVITLNDVEMPHVFGPTDNEATTYGVVNEVEPRRKLSAELIPSEPSIFMASEEGLEPV
jgi:hypothetical protein